MKQILALRPLNTSRNRQAYFITVGGVFPKPAKPNWRMKMSNRTRCACAALTFLVACFATAAQTASAAASATVCIALPRAQLGQGNNSSVDVSEPVRTTLGTYMAGPAVQLVRLDARIPVQIDAEAAQKHCQYVLQSSVAQKKGGGGMGFLKSLAPLAGVLPMMGGMGGMGGNMGVAGAMVAQTVASGAAQAAAQSMQQEAMAAMTGAQQSNVKRGDTITVEYTLSKPGDAATPMKQTLQSKAKQDGEDLLGPMLEQVATAVITAMAAS